MWPDAVVLPDRDYDTTFRVYSAPENQPWYYRWFRMTPSAWYDADTDTIYVRDRLDNTRGLRKAFLNATRARKFKTVFMAYWSWLRAKQAVMEDS